MLHVEEVPQFRVEHKVEEAAEGPENNDKLNDECRKSHKTQTNGGGDLFEGFLETVREILVLNGMVLIAKSLPQ